MTAVRHALHVVIGLPMLLLAGVSQSQDLKNTSWVKIKRERKDGSRIVERISTARGVLKAESLDHYIKYDFGENTVQYFLPDFGDPVDQPYAFGGGKLSLGYFNDFLVDSFTDSSFSISPASKFQFDDRVDRWVFINSKYYLSYLTKGKLIDLNADTIVANNYLHPTRKGLARYAREAWGRIRKNGSFSADLIISPIGKVTSVSIFNRENMDNDEVRKFATMNLLKGELSLDLILRS